MTERDCEETNSLCRFSLSTLSSHKTMEGCSLRKFIVIYLLAAVRLLWICEFLSGIKLSSLSINDDSQSDPQYNRLTHLTSINYFHGGFRVRLVGLEVN